MKSVLITGITGFAGSHLADYVLAEHPDVEVWGTYRWRSRRENIEHLEGKIHLIECDLDDAVAVRKALDKARPDAVFHLAAQSFVPTSWTAPGATLHSNVAGQVNLYEGVRALGLDPTFQIACSSEEYGLVLPDETPIRESNPLRPLSPTRSPRSRKTSSAINTSRATASSRCAPAASTTRGRGGARCS